MNNISSFLKNEKSICKIILIQKKWRDYLLNQYNKFLRKKLGILQDIDVSYHSQKVGLSMRIAL